MKAKKKSFRKSGAILSKPLPPHYDSLDAPVFVWARVLDTGDLSWLLHKRVKVNEAMTKQLTEVWEKIYNDYIKEFGLSESYLTVLEREREICMLQVEMAQTGDRSIKTFIKIAQQELQGIKEAEVKATFMDTKIAIENRFKFQVNLHQTSIREFYAYIPHLKAA